MWLYQHRLDWCLFAVSPLVAEILRQLLEAAAAGGAALEVLNGRLLLHAQLFVLALALFLDHDSLATDIQRDRPADLLVFGEIGTIAQELVILVAIDLDDATKCTKNTK